MRNKATPEQIDKVLTLLGEAWKKYPEQRLGQLLINICSQMWGAGTVETLWNLDEDTLAEDLKDLLKNGW